MADGTRFKLLDDSVKGLQESTHSLQLAQSAIKDAQHHMGLSKEALRSDVSELATSLEDQKKTMNKVLVQLSLLTKQSKSKGTGNYEGDTSDGGLPTDAATWEDKQQFLRSFPSFHLEDKVNFKGDGNVVNDTDKQPNSQDLDSPKEENDQPKVRRSKRERKTSNKWKEFVCSDDDDLKIFLTWKKLETREDGLKLIKQADGPCSALIRPLFVDWKVRVAAPICSLSFNSELLEPACSDIND
ncbi:hypothetical protein E3N88_14536 [Mikania micrantha]|uniref:Uncharacterized protein n=1 Tax=Mikania micrantha TaxID=192012 RepID=A0A5N6P4B3_9ASTR|nr:hypothetical protein E3N88_14536 [Mikania micrantha]